MTAEECDSIAALTGRRNFMAIDTREDPAFMQWHYVRPWVKGGSRWREGMPVSPQDASEISARMRLMADVPLAVIVRLKDARWSSFSEALAEDQGSRRVFQIVDSGGRLHANGSPLGAGLRMDLTRTTELRLTAANSRTLWNTDFPRAISFMLADPLSAANLVRVEAANQHEECEARLPEPVWLRLNGRARRGRLYIDVVPGDRRDGWQFRAEPEDVQLVRVPEPVKPDQLRRAAVVFDRTCPDWEHWADSLMLSQEVHEAPARFPTFNEGIRKAVGDTLASADWRADARCCVTWFADVAGQGISLLKGVPQPGATSGVAGIFEASAGPCELFDHLTYFPGLDVWDPVEEALAATIRFFRESDGGAIFIVGNSPPTYPGPHGPLAGIASTFGFETSCRAQSDRWERVRAELASLGVEVYYVFLRLGDGTGVHLAEAAVFGALQDRVEEALRMSLPGRVLSARATPQGVADALGRAMRQARLVESCRSGVELLDD